MSSAQLEKNKQIVRDFFAAQSDPTADPNKDCADDIIFWIAGGKSQNPSKIAGRWQGDSLAELRVLLGGLIASMDRFDLINLTAEEDRVAVEAEGFIKMQDGTIYNNEYHFLFFVRDGKIQEVKEYLDTVLVNELFGVLAEA